MPAGRIEGLDVRAFSVPTDAPESDGTLAWDHTVMVLVQVRGAGQAGLGYTYASRGAGLLVQDVLARSVVGADVLSPGACYQAMGRQLRNLGRKGLGWMALSAVDAACWDLKARVLGLPLSSLLGAVRPAVDIPGPPSVRRTGYNRPEAVTRPC